MDFSKILDWLKNRGLERSTWVGLAAVGAVFGLGVFDNPAFVQAFGDIGTNVAEVVAAVLAAIAVARKSPTSPDA